MNNLKIFENKKNIYQASVLLHIPKCISQIKNLIKNKMKAGILTTTLLLITLIFNVNLCKAQCNRNDWDALKAFYDSTEGDSWEEFARVGWETMINDRTNPPTNCNLDDLYGIKLDEEGRVECIDLDTNPTNCKAVENVNGGIGLNGILPSELSKLTNLKCLNLLNLYNDTINVLAGSIPTELGLLKKLEYINLGFHQLTGELPIELTELPNLETLALYGNQLSGSIPAQVDNLTKMKEIHLAGNKLSGDIPFAEIISLPQLEKLFLNGNDLTGTITNEIICKPSLIKLSLSGNKLKGEIPICENTGMESQLTELFINDNQLTGSIPLEINYFKNLIKLGLSGNQLDGEIPTTLSELNQLERLFLSNNLLSGEIPGQLNQLNHLKILFLNKNNLRGNIPVEIGDLVNLEELWLSDNALSGTIPESIGDLANLKLLYLSNNFLSDSIPTRICSLQKLEKLGLYDNYISGSIPSCLTEMTSLNQLWLAGNNLSGSIPINLIRDGFRTSITNNYFNCGDVNTLVENNQLASNNSNSYNKQNYRPQNYEDINRHIFDTLTTDRSVTLEAKLRWELTGSTTYQWYKNDEKINSGNSPTLAISEVGVDNVGTYSLHIKSVESCGNAKVEFISDPITVLLRGHDLNGLPIKYRELIVEFENKTIKQNYEKELLADAIWKDKCDCNRELHLYDFGGDEESFQNAYLSLNQKIQSPSMPPDVDGGFNYTLNNINFDVNAERAHKVSYNFPSASYNDVSITYVLDSGLDQTNLGQNSGYLLQTAPIENCYNLRAPGYNFSTIFDYVDDRTATINTDFQDNVGHGTFGYRTISEGLEDAGNAKIVPIKITDKAKGGKVFDLICGLYHAIDNNADVINISAGYNGDPIGILEDAVYEAKRKGIFIVVSAGNDGLNIDDKSNVPQYPAYYANKEKEIFDDSLSELITITFDNLISVAAVNNENHLWEGSNYGNESVTLAAPGENIAGYGLADSVKVGSGTSFAAFLTTQVLAREIARDNSRSFDEVLADFKEIYMEANNNLINSTITGLQINFDSTPADIYGCTNPNACNYEPFATIDNGLCYECAPIGCNNCPDDCIPCGIEEIGEIPQIAEDYSFLIDFVDFNNCNGIGIKVFDFGHYAYALINNNGEITMYADYYDSPFCSGSSCTNTYNLTNPDQTWSCGDTDDTPTSTCNDGIQNGNEAGIDCGVPCSPCPPNNPSSISEDYPFLNNFIDFNNCNGISIEVFDFGHYAYALINNNGEITMYADYYDDPFCSGSSCANTYNLTNPDQTWSCGDTFDTPTSTCNDGIRNGNEIDIDCGGSCDPCPPNNPSSISEEYPFLNNFVDFTNCNGIGIEVFDFGHYAYALINNNGEITMYADYYDDPFCSGSICANTYNLTSPDQTWSCGQPTNKSFSNHNVIEAGKVINSIKVYPNPATDFINIELVKEADSDNSVSVFDISGKLMRKETFTGNYATFNVSELPKGIYIIELQNTKFKSTQKLLIE